MNRLLRYIPAPFELLRNHANVNPLIINYHVVSNKHLPHISQLYPYRDVKQFIDDLDFLLANFYPINLENLLESSKNNTKLPVNSFLITFDDGFKEIYDIVMPIMMKKKIMPVIFMTTDYIDNKILGNDQKKSLIIEEIKKNKKSEYKTKKLLNVNDQNQNELVKSILKIPYHEKDILDMIAGKLDIDFNKILENNKPYLTSEQIKKLMGIGFSFGSHSIDHPYFAELSLEEQINQTIASMNYICNNFEINYRVFAFPYWDGKISLEYFERISNDVDLTFGTQGLIDDPVKTNFQRISVEKYSYKAKNTIKSHYIRKLVYKLFSKDSLIRS